MNTRKAKPPARFFFYPINYKFLFLLLAILLILRLAYGINWRVWFPIQTVRVYGVNHTEPNQIKMMLAPLVNRGYFGVNVEMIRARLLQTSWVEDLSVRRIWPDQIEITLTEKTPIARWNMQSLLSNSGELFLSCQDSFSSLPLFVGPSGKQVMMMQYFNDLNRLLAPLRVKISYLELTPYFTWKLSLDNGVLLQLDHKEVLTRLGHFVKVYPKIIGKRAAEVDYIDLRYPNGVAIRWKAPVKGRA